jgi:hypothetical protein
MSKFHLDGTKPTNGEIFVFGSNLAGRHGAGAARVARISYGAVMGIGMGLVGQSYAIPTKDKNLNTIPLSEIAKYVDTFKRFAQTSLDREYFVTAIGCGLAGYSHEDIAPMFRGSPDNCNFPEEWRVFFDEQ